MPADPKDVLETFQLYCDTPSDIHEHLPLLKLLASECESVTEFGMRRGVSTVALLAGLLERKEGGSLTSYDVDAEAVLYVAGGLGLSCDTNTVGTVRAAGTIGKVDVRLFARSSLDAMPCHDDMLFVDSLHTYSQLKAELARHGVTVKKWLAFHDTVTYGKKSEDGTEPGLHAAIREWLESRVPEPVPMPFRFWTERRDYLNNNGLTVMGRVPLPEGVPNGHHSLIVPGGPPPADPMEEAAFEESDRYDLRNSEATDPMEDEARLAWLAEREPGKSAALEAAKKIPRSTWPQRMAELKSPLATDHAYVPPPFVSNGPAWCQVCAMTESQHFLLKNLWRPGIDQVRGFREQETPVKKPTRPAMDRLADLRRLPGGRAIHGSAEEFVQNGQAGKPGRYALKISLTDVGYVDMDATDLDGACQSVSLLLRGLAGRVLEAAEVLDGSRVLPPVDAPKAETVEELRAKLKALEGGKAPDGK